MPEVRENLKSYAAGLFRHRELTVALFMVWILVIIIVPQNPVMMDFMLALNLTFSLILLLTTIYIARPLEFSVFPSLLLIATLFRLALNIATTRLILSQAHAEGMMAAGEIVGLFGDFVGGSDVLIGATVFAIIVIIQFIVITKGATRISEVAARFTLDAVPGKQMAIEADVSSGLIDPEEALKRRNDLQREMDFYGNMDGASKFVRGDAIAGIVITIVNIAVGLVIGVVRYDMDVAEAGTVFTILTIGDGLVSQIPALLISVAAGLLVTRSASQANLGHEIVDQIFSQRKALGIATILLCGLGAAGFVGFPFPSLPLLLIGAACGAGWYFMDRAIAAEEATEREEEARAGGEAAPAEEQEAQKKPENFLRIDPMECVIGYGLVPLVDTGQAGGGGLLSRIQMIRQQIASELGVIVPPIRVYDDIRLEANDYLIKIHGDPVARGNVIPDRLLAMDSGMASGRIDGIETTEPAFGLPAVWVLPNQQGEAEAAGYTVVDAETVLATHLTEIIKNNAHNLLTREETRRLLNNLREHAGELVGEVVDQIIDLADVQKVLQNLLRERVSIRNLEAVIEALGNYARRTKDPDVLTEYVRNALSRWICNEYAEEDGAVYVVTLDPRLEDRIQRSVEHTEGGSFLALRPDEIQQIGQAVEAALQELLRAGHLPILLTSPQIRPLVKRITENRIPSLVVLAHNEILPEYNVVSMGMAATAAESGQGEQA